jgi:hypothetical protein
MSAEKEHVDAYLATVARLEPDIAMIDASAFYASAAISLKRIADILCSDTERRRAYLRYWCAQNNLYVPPENEWPHEFQPGIWKP